MKSVKFYFMSLIAMIAFALPTQAQNFHYGVKVGTNFAVQSGVAQYFNNSNIRVGLHAGVAGSYNLGKNTMLISELNYDQNGSHSSTVTEKYDYLTLPVLFDYSFGKTDRKGTTMHLNIGPYVSYLVNAKKEVKLNGITSTTNVYSDANKGEFGGMLGIGLIQPVGKHEITVDVRLNVGLTPFTPNGGDNDHNKSIGVYLGYML